MERETNITVWQLRLFEGFNQDIMVMQRDEEEVFDDAIHVFFEKTYYDAYVARAVQYGLHRYAYHEDKLGEVINQIFDENILGLVLHVSANEEAAKTVLCGEKYIAQKELLGLKDVADSYHFMYTLSIDRCVKEDAIARLWTKNVYIIGQLPGKKPVFELMTMKRKKDGGTATAEDFDYESLKVFLTADSAMRFNPDKKPISKYKLSMLSQIVKGRFQVIIEPHREYFLEFDPANLDLTGHLNVPRFDEEKVKARIRAFTEMDRIYILLNPIHSDYRALVGNPFLMKADDKNVMMFLFETYEDAVHYVLQNPAILPVFDSTFPIGVIDRGDNLQCLETVIALAAKLGVTGVNLDIDTLHAIVCKIEYFRDTAGYNSEVETLLHGDDLAQVMREEDGKKQYRMPAVAFCDRHNSCEVEESRKTELIEHMDNDVDQGIAYLAGCSIMEMMVLMQEAAIRFDSARKAEDEEGMVKYNLLMNKITIPLTEALCEKPFIYTLREDNGDFTLKNNVVYLIITNRYEASRKGEGRLMPVGIDNPQFMEKLCETSKVAALTDGPTCVCLVDTKLMGEVAKRWKQAEPLREELMVYMTQGCDFSYPEAKYYYRRIKSDDSIFIEFVSAVKNNAYPSVGMLKIEGHTAEGLAKANGLSMPQAYDCLLTLKMNPAYAQELKSESVQENDGGNAEHGNETKKGFFGKIFKK